MSLPNSEIRPRDGRSARYISFSRLVLPAPLGPVRKWNEPAGELHGDVAQHLGARAVPHADILEAYQGARSPSHRGMNLAARRTMT